MVGHTPVEEPLDACELILPAVEESMKLLKEGKYNELVQMQLSYKHRVGVIKRSEIWAVDPKKKKEAFGGLTEDDVDKFKTLIASGINHEDKIGRIKEFTANDFLWHVSLGTLISKDMVIELTSIVSFT